MIVYELGAEVNVWFDSFWIIACLGIIHNAIDSKRQERLPSVLKRLAHRACYAVIIVANHRPDILSLWIVATLGCDILLEAVKMESMRALLEGHTCLVVWIEYVLEL